jgi:hypothetical protein
VDTGTPAENNPGDAGRTAFLAEYPIIMARFGDILFLPTVVRRVDQSEQEVGEGL